MVQMRLRKLPVAKPTRLSHSVRPLPQTVARCGNASAVNGALMDNRMRLNRSNDSGSIMER